MQSPCLAIVAGAGDLPIQIVEHCKNNDMSNYHTNNNNKSTQKHSIVIFTKTAINTTP